MKLLFSSLIASLAASTVSGQTLAEKWQIGEPSYTWTPAENKIDLDYALSTFIIETNPSVEIFDAACGTGGNSKTAGFTTALTGLEGITSPDDSAESFSVDGRLSQLDVTLDMPTLAADADLFSDDGANKATIVFCVRYSLEATGDLEVNFLENLITMSIDLSAGFTVDSFDVAPKDKIESTAVQTYNVDAKLCVGSGADSNAVKADPPVGTVYNQGSLITVCVYPDADAAADGIVMNNIDSYTWKRQDPDVNGVTPPEIFQNAIGGGIADGNGLTSFSSCNGSDVCVFDSILFANFYATQGAVNGVGIATLQFARRRLGANGSQRKLQQADQAADFGLNVDVNALDDGPGALATAGGATLGMTALVSFMGLVSALLV